MLLENRPELLTVKETAAVLRISKTLCYQAIKKGEIPSKKFGRVIRVPRSYLEKVIQNDNA